IIAQLKRVKKEYGQPRKSNIIEVSEIKTVSKEEVTVEDYNVKIMVTKDGYLKKIPLTSLRNASGIRLKDTDEVVGEFDIGNNSDILVFTSKQNVYKLKTYDLKDHKPSELGEYLYNLLGLNKDDEFIQYVTVTNDYSGDLLVGF